MLNDVLKGLVVDRFQVRNKAMQSLDILLLA